MRSGLRRGLEMEQRIGANPYKFGVVGASDSHTALVSVDEDDFHGKYANDAKPENKSRPTVPTSVGWDAAAQGLSAVWAEENTRDAITAAFKRREVYATSGPRIALRVFGGRNFKRFDAKRPNMATIGYRKGVPMGGELNAGKAPVQLLIHATKDPMSEDLERVQVIKGWVDAMAKAMKKSMMRRAPRLPAKASTWRPGVPTMRAAKRNLPSYGPTPITMRAIMRFIMCGSWKCRAYAIPIWMRWPWRPTRPLPNMTALFASAHFRPRYG